MIIDRRSFIQFAGALSVAGALGPTRANGLPASRFKVIFFDAFPVFDARPIASLTQQLFPKQGAELAALWRTRQFEYQWLRALSGTYDDFWRVTEDSLRFACASLKVELNDESLSALMNSFLTLKAWPDVIPALQRLKQRGLKLAFLSNMTQRMLEANARSAGVHGLFDEYLSTDALRTYKPDPRAYQLGLDRMKVKREHALFVAFAGWDAAGAKAFGYSTCWVNRMQAPQERLGAVPDSVAADLAVLDGIVTG